jgi:hypothetical protein
VFLRVRTFSGFSGEKKTAANGIKVITWVTTSSRMACGWIKCTHIHGTVQKKNDWILEELRNIA